MYVKRVRVDNVKGFPEVDFELDRPDGSLAGWTVFVGGNSSGKSALLKSIALGLIGPDAGGRLLGRPAAWTGWIRTGQTKASISLTLTRDKKYDLFRGNGDTRRETLRAGVFWRLEKKKDEVPQFGSTQKRDSSGRRDQWSERGPWSANAEGWFSAGYGPMRRLSGGGTELTRFALSKDVENRFITLFREDAALSESEEWLRRMHSRSLESEKPNGIEKIVDGVKALLGDGLLPLGMKVSRITVDHVFIVDERGVELPMRDISDGCRSIYATILDLVHGLFEVYGAEGLFGVNADDKPVVTRPGVVIIDEIEAHLHPSWQRDIPCWLKTHFPAIQFLVSTHSPLIAQAADPNGLFLLPMQNDSARAPRPASPEEYDKIRLGTAHKTVLGVAFGLDSTRTRWAENQIRRWQELNAQARSGIALSSSDRREHNRLREQMEIAFEGSEV